ncbi:hypothetical protein GCM10009680_57340 [Streptomyces yatensis]|uniref:VTT domain-containing protein n=1 Tax=Streptomyces yatensis TaxID=155177 RepID=A0ABP4UNU3_9ACTN
MPLALNPLDAAQLLNVPLPGVLLAAAAGVLLGAQAGYPIGRRAGRVLPAGTRGRHLSDGVRRAEELLARYGHGKAIVLARFIPVVRTVLNPLAGMAGVPARTFALWQVSVLPLALEALGVRRARTAAEQAPGCAK